MSERIRGYNSIKSFDLIVIGMKGYHNNNYTHVSNGRVVVALLKKNLSGESAIEDVTRLDAERTWGEEANRLQYDSHGRYICGDIHMLQRSEWRDVTWRDITWHHVTSRDTTRHDKTRHDTTRHDTTRHDTTRHDTTRHDTTRHDTTRHDTTRHDTTRHPNACMHSKTQELNLPCFKIIIWYPIYLLTKHPRATRMLLTTPVPIRVHTAGLQRCNKPMIALITITSSYCMYSATWGMPGHAIGHLIKIHESM